LIVLKPEIVNIVCAVFQEGSFDYDTFQIKNIDICIPRPVEKKFSKRMIRKPTIEVWTLRDSIFRDYKIANEEMLNDCFEFDWGMISKPRLRETTNIEQLRACLKKIYPSL
jgi:hypothetical protein